MARKRIKYSLTTKGAHAAVTFKIGARRNGRAFCRALGPLRNLQFERLRDDDGTLRPRARRWPVQASTWGRRVAPVRPQAPVGDQRHAVALTAIQAATGRPGAPIGVVHVSTGAGLRRTSRNRKGRCRLHQEAPAAQLLTASAAHPITGRLDADAVVVLLTGYRLSAPGRREQPEDRDSEADCYCC